MGKLKKILIVDDDNISNYIVGRLLEKLQISERYQVCKNGKEALEFIFKKCAAESGSKVCPELIFLDHLMPVMDGIEFVEALKVQNFKNWEDVKIVIMFPNLNAKDISQYVSLGISEFIEKPLTEEKVYELISKYFPDEMLSDF